MLLLVFFFGGDEVRNLRSRSAAAGVAGDSALLCMTVCTQVWGNGHTRCLPTQYRVNLGVLAAERQQTTKMWESVCNFS